MGTVTDWIVALMGDLGSPGAGLLVALESIFPPIPSELILPLAGFAASRGDLNLAAAVAWTTLGSLVGAVVLYALGAKLGEDRLRAAARRIPLVRESDIDKVDAWFDRHGGKAVFFGRMVPGVRSLISIPAGVARMPVPRFVLLTLAGSLVWNALLIAAGYALGSRWEVVQTWVGRFQEVVIVLAVLAVVVVVVRRVRENRATAEPGRLVTAAGTAAAPVAPGPVVPARPGLLRLVAQDLRWAFRRPYGWLLGIGINLVLSLAYLVVVPLRGGTHRDWAVLVGTYFAVFVLADVTTTNVLGVDTERTRLRLLRGISLTRILVVKNLALLVIVGLPTLVATAVITVHDEPDYRLVLTLPGVLYPVLTWLGVGNLVSVLLPYWPVPLTTRWRERRVWSRTLRWLVCLGLPYALCVAVDPMSRLPRTVSHALRLPPGAELHGAELLTLGLLAWACFTAVAVVVAHRRGVPFDDLR